MSNAHRKGYGYHVSEEQLRKYLSLTTKEKLEWLYEANEFTNKFASGGAKRLHGMFRRGEI